MPAYRAQVILPFFTNLPTDVIVNQFHFTSTVDDVDAVGVVVAAGLETFYQEVYGTSAAERVSYINWTGIRMKLFNLDDPTPRVPYISDPFTFTNGTAASSVPTEVACVLSFQAERESGVRYQRLYNRIFLGGVPQAAIAGSTAATFPRFTAAWTNGIITAAQNLLEFGDTQTVPWVQASSATGALITRTVAGGWVDNSPDTQRRRSVLANVRTNWVPLP